MDKGIISSLGTASGVVILLGVTVSVLQSQLENTYCEEWVILTNILNETEAVKTTAFSGSWIYGIWYIFPGILGLVAALVQNKCMYVTTCIFTSMILFAMAIFIIMYAVLLLILLGLILIVSGQCTTVGGNCTCSNSTTNYTSTYFGECPDNSKLIGLVLAVIAFHVLAWLAEILELFMACYYSCCRKQPTPPQQQMYILGQYPMPQDYRPPEPDMMPQPHDQPGPDTMPQAYGQPGHDMMPQAYDQPGPYMMPQADGQPGHYSMPQSDGKGYPLPGNV